MKNAIFFFSMILFLSCNQSGKNDYLQITGHTQGTTYTITYKDSLNRNIQPMVDSLLMVIDQSVSTYKKESSITQFNDLRDTSSWFEVDDVFYQNVILSKHINKISDGAFDPTVAPLFNYYDFDNGGKSTVDSAKIESILNQRVGMGLIEIDFETKSIRKLKSDVILNFNAVAQGFSVDFIAVNFNTIGIKNYMIEVGGEILTRGKNPNNSQWRLGIDSPNDKSKPGESLQKIVNLSDKALATSGNYRKFFKIGDKRYSHTLNPLTGFPVNHNLLSVSVIAGTCAEADAYATAFMVLGVKKSLELIENDSLNVEVYFISSVGEGLIEKQTEGFQLN